MDFGRCLGVARCGYLIIIMILMGCVHHFVKESDSDDDGIIERRAYYRGAHLVKETFDRDADHVMDYILYYNSDGRVSMVETDTNGDAMIDTRDMYYNNMTSKSQRDDDYDGIMDRAWMSHYSEGKRIVVEHDLNHDGIMDIRMNMGVQENFVNGLWVEDVSRNGKHGMIIGNTWLELDFYEGQWIVMEAT